MIGRVDAAEWVGEVHVDFDEEVCEKLEGAVGDVVGRADCESALFTGGDIKEEPEALGIVSVHC